MRWPVPPRCKLNALHKLSVRKKIAASSSIAPSLLEREALWKNHRVSYVTQTKHKDNYGYGYAQ